MNAERLTDFQSRIGRVLSGQLFFIAGAPKSGTTWVQRLLDAHPEIVCSGEGHFANKIAPPCKEAPGRCGRGAGRRAGVESSSGEAVRMAENSDVPGRGVKTVLHVGCGPYNPAKLHKTFHGPGWRELRLDIDPRVAPDIVASMTVLPLAGQAVDAVSSSHGLEHLYAQEVAVALSEFHRVLKPDGFALITLPDLQKVTELVAADSLEGTAYVSPTGPIAPIDMIYGHRASIARGNRFMAHRTGFTAKTLGNPLFHARFAQARVSRSGFDLWAFATKQGQATASASY